MTAASDVGRTPSASIVVTVTDDAERTARAVAALTDTAARAVEVEVIVVDPRPAGRPRPGRFDGARVVSARPGRSAAEHRNAGARAATNDVVVFLDDRVTPRPGSLDALVAAFTLEPVDSAAVGIVGAKVTSGDGRLVHAGGWLIDDRRRGGVRPVARWFAEAATRPGADAPARVAVVGGGIVAVERALFEALGGFTEAYRTGFEDADLCVRAAALGRAVWYEPAASATVVDRIETVRPWAAGTGDDARRFASAWRRGAAVDLVVRADASAVPGLPADAAGAAAGDPLTGTAVAGPTVRWVGSLFGLHSLAQVNRELAVRLVHDHGHRCDPVWPEIPDIGVADDPRLEPLVRAALTPGPTRPDLTIQHGWPPNWVPPADDRPWVVIQPWEFGCLPTSWVGPLRDLVDEYWVPSTWIRRCAIASGVPAHQVRVVPNGVDRHRLRPDGPRYPLATRAGTRFLFVGGAIKRKGIDVLVESYLQAFTPADDVCLVLKLSGGHSFYKGSLDDRLRELAARTDVPAIEIIDDGLSNDEIAALYRACTALVHPYRGEGFGMPIAEAMACGLPVIVTGEGAALDFCSADNAYLVRADTVRLDPATFELGPPAGAYWLAEPDRADLVRLLRHVHTHPDEAAARGAAGRRTVLAQLDWDRIADDVAGHVRLLVGRTARRLDPLAPFDPAVEPVALDDPRATTVLLEIDAGDAWVAPLGRWIAAMGAADEVTLVLVTAAEDDLGVVAPHTAAFAGDVLVVLTEGRADKAAAAYAACTAVLGSSAVSVDRAGRMGRPVLPAASDAELRGALAALGSFSGSPVR